MSILSKFTLGKVFPTTVIKGLAPLFLYLLAFLIIAATILGKSEIGIYFLISIFPLKNVRDKLITFPGGNNVIDWLFLALVFASFFKRDQADETAVAKTKEGKLILVYVLCTFAYLLWGSLNLGLDFSLSPNNGRLINWKNHMLLPLLYFMIFKHIRDKRQIKIVFFIMFVSCVYSSRLFASSAHTIGHFDWARRGAGVFIHLGPNEMASFLVDYVVLAIGVFLYAKNSKYRYILLIGIIWICYAALFTYSRGAYVAFLISLTYLLSVKRKLLIIPTIIVLVCWRLILPAPVIERIDMTGQGDNNTGFESSSLESSSAGRLELWKHGLYLFAANPLGHGFDTIYLLGFQNYYKTRVSSDPHNKYVEFMVEMGILGLLLFLGLLSVAFRNGWKLYSKSEDSFFKGLGIGFCACVISVAVTNFFGDRWTYVEVGCYFWASWALVGRALSIEKSQQRSLL
jgi:O-antigen ligase